MLEALTEYVAMIVENSDEANLNKEQIEQIANNLLENEELWDTIDSYIYQEIDDQI